MMRSRGGKLKEEREGGREGGLLTLDQEEVSHFTYKDTHPQKLDNMAKSKKRQFTPLECLM
jgi:hypothetical protein